MAQVRYLLDTHALLWWLFDDPQLSVRARAILADREYEVLVSSASAWEIATKHRLGRLGSAAPLIADFTGWVRRAGFGELPMASSHALRAGGWATAHRDPFDRMLAAQCVIDNLRLVSRDPVFAEFGLEPLW